MKLIAVHRSRIYFIGIVLLALIVVFFVAPTILRCMFPMPYFSIVEKYAKENGISITLVYAVMKAESGFEEKAVSPKQAMGLMQITEKTGSWIASNLDVRDFSAEELIVPEVNVRFGCWYLSYLINRFDGNKELALAAYNAGEGTVDKWINSGDIVWKGLEIKQLPFKETEKYLVRVNRIYFVYKSLYPKMDSW